jgi:hypothetical protein
MVLFSFISMVIKQPPPLIIIKQYQLKYSLYDHRDIVERDILYNLLGNVMQQIVLSSRRGNTSTI